MRIEKIEDYFEPCPFDGGVWEIHTHFSCPRWTAIAVCAVCQTMVFSDGESATEVDAIRSLIGKVNARNPLSSLRLEGEDGNKHAHILESEKNR